MDVFSLLMLNVTQLLKKKKKTENSPTESGRLTTLVNIIFHYAWLLEDSIDDVVFSVCSLADVGTSQLDLWLIKTSNFVKESREENTENINEEECEEKGDAERWLFVCGLPISDAL